MGRYDSLYPSPGRIFRSWGVGVVDALNELANVVFNPLIKMIVKTASPSPGLNGSYGTPVTLTPSSGKGWIVLMIKLSWSGTFASGESVSIRLTFTYSDNTTYQIVKTSTSVTSIWFSNDDLSSIFKDGTYITKIDVDSSTNKSATSVTTTAYIYGIEG